MSELGKQRGKPYKYGITEVTRGLLEPMARFLGEANRSRKTSIICFLSQCVAIFLTLVFAIKVLPEVLSYSGKFIKIIEPDNISDIKRLFLAFISYFVYKSLPTKFTFSDYFDLDLKVSMMLNVALICVIIGWTYYLTSFKNFIKGWLKI